MAIVAPSILSADFANLQRELEDMKAAGITWVHVDIMDGHFVPNISIGIPVVKSLRKVTDLTLDVHLMITEPIRYAKAFCEAGADLVTVHLEADTPEKIHETLSLIRSMGVKAGISVKPGTPAEALEPFLKEVDLILVMTVEPGFGGQKFLDNQMAKVRRLRDEITRRGLKTRIQVDGGVSPKTAHIVAEAGADVLVAGSAVYGAENPAQAIDDIRAKAEAAFKA